MFTTLICCIFVDKKPNHDHMNNALTIARYLIGNGIKDKMPITPMKLQKIVYFSYGWYFAYYNEKLFSDSIQAWDYGPVVEAVYHQYKFYGPTPILKMEHHFRDNLINPIKHDKKLFLDQMWALYRNYSGVQLANATHMEGTPWYKTKQQHPFGRNIVISDNLIKEYFVNLKNSSKNGG